MVIFDASALIAYMFDEEGAAIVEANLLGAAMSTVNLAEVFTRRAYPFETGESRGSVSVVGEEVG